MRPDRALDMAAARPAAWAALVALLAVIVAGCALGPTTAAPPAVYDLGPSGHAGSADKAMPSLASVRVAEVGAPARLQGTGHRLSAGLLGSVVARTVP